MIFFCAERLHDFFMRRGYCAERLLDFFLRREVAAFLAQRG